MPQVEFVGLPAVGKTHLADAVAQQLSANTEGISVTTSSGIRADRTSVGTVSCVIRRLLQDPGRSLGDLRLIRATEQGRWRRVLRYWLYHLYVLDELRSARATGKLHLADQGYLQHLWRIHLTAEESSRSDLSRWIDRVPLSTRPDFVIFVEIDHRTRMERGEARGNEIDPSLFDPTHPEIQRDIVAYEDIVATTKATDIDWIQVENTESGFSDNVTRLEKEITDRVSRTIVRS